MEDRNDFFDWLTTKWQMFSDITRFILLVLVGSAAITGLVVVIVAFATSFRDSHQNDVFESLKQADAFFRNICPSENISVYCSGKTVNISDGHDWYSCVAVAGTRLIGAKCSKNDCKGVEVLIRGKSQ